MNETREADELEVEETGGPRKHAIHVRELEHVYGTGKKKFTAVDHISFSVEESRFYTLLGPSGCGKSTTLHCIAGLERPTSGEIELGDTVVVSSRRFVPTHRRDIGMVFQDYAVWPHMTVFENVAFPLRVGRTKVRDIKDRVMKVLETVGMAHLSERRPSELSGGQQQRVSLARALVREPSVLLLDEPLSNLDATLREQMRAELRQIQRRLKVTTIFVTHDQYEALAMSNRIAVMRNGTIVQEGTPREIYREPKDAFVASFIGVSSFLEGTVASVGDDGFGWVDANVGRMRTRVSPDVVAGDRVLVVVRPEGVVLEPLGTEGQENHFPAVVDYRLYLGGGYDYRLQVGGVPVRATRPANEPYRNKDKAVAHLPAEECIAIPAGDEKHAPPPGTIMEDPRDQVPGGLT
ncbi:ABC transporter ATP-binding protein [Jiangella mangrovi]|uniref:Iron(III) transport system ATP-binding protein n=1 Tax=Jiangella mangrovi TaxID=1524084 RepID=A0A7W9GQG4_9ACTN|nr:ABC transporter ATP-binding protein [Jiangella mangrovi]MBB5788134.1 iron(III) transport system ATP-binding protein [Jiangella mangrovi]